MNNKQIIFTEINKAELLDVEYKAPSDDEVAVELAYSSISCGTEKANITGDPNVSIYSTNVVEFPRTSGYSSSGIVIAKGSNVDNLEIGDRVALEWSTHKKINVLNKKNVIKISDNTSMQDAALFHIATFPMAAIRKTRLEIGESMLVMGLGILGLFAVQLAKTAGAAPVIAVDPVAERREKALKFGADYALDPFSDDFVDTVKKLTSGGVNTAIEVTGIGAGLNQCLDCMARFGRISLLGCTRDKNFTVDYYRKVHGPGIQLIGAHTMARPQFESAPGYFTAQDDVKTLDTLTALKRISLAEMVDEIHSPYNCQEVYTRLINDKNFPVVSQFDWSDVK